MSTEDRFKQSTVATLARRAANRCSNPDCNAITSGPSDDPIGSVNVGEAAHIFGANPGSARFSEDMSPAERSAISNAIWLCATCHKLVDDDPSKYPTGLLFEWQREHERIISEQVGKAGAESRKRYEKRHLEEFGRLSYLAERIIVEKDALWEYRLTAEVLRFEMGPVLQRWNALRKKLYLKPSARIVRADFMPWVVSRMDEAIMICVAFAELANNEFSRGWGEPGVAGNEAEIVATCRLFSEMCQSALAWEESVRFVTVDKVFSETQSLLIGVVGGMVDEAAKIPAFLSETLAGNPTSGKYFLDLTITLPDGWVDGVSQAMQRATRAIESGAA